MASAVGGINVIVQPTTLINTIISGNLDPNGGPSDIEKGGSGSINTAGSFNNLIGTAGSTGLTNGTNGNLVGVLDPKLVPVGNYGGPVPTAPIRPSSQARNAGRNTGAPAADARGFNRPQATTVDIGAFELQTNSIVTNTLNSGAGSLRDVVTVVPAFEIVQFESPLFDSPQTISLSSGQIALSQSQAIVGPDATLLTITSTAAASSTSRAFFINSGVLAILGDMKIANNHVTMEGGAISNGGTLTVRTCVVDSNTSVNEGGGIANGANATLSVIDSTISNNTTGSLNGGGVGSYGAVTVTGSTFVGNSATTSGGGIGILNGGGLNGSLTATNSTFSANQAAVAGGGVSFDTSMSNALTNCTITLNQQTNVGTSGGGINVLAGTVTLKNTIIANNTKNGGTQSDITGTVSASSSFNLIGTGGAGGLTNGVNNNQVGVADAKLVALGNYGGPTQTHLLSINSPARNTGTSSGAPTTDQRGLRRSVGGTYDIGAVEANITVTPATLPTGTVGTAYPGQTFSTSGGSGDFTFGLIGTLPNGMGFSPVGADISGTPTQSGSFPIIVTATDNTNGIAGATSYTLTINPQVLHHFAIANISSPKTAGSAFSITITAEDASNNTVLGFNGTVVLSTTAGTIIPTASDPFTNGVLTQSVAVTQSGTGKTITVDDGNGHTKTSNTFTVNAGALDHFAIANISSPQTAGTAFNVTLTAQDAYNNTVTSFTGTVGLGTTAGTISPPTSSAFTSGTRTQSVSVTQAGAGQTITVTRTGGTETGTSNTFSVNAGALHHFAIGNISTPQTAGTAFNIALTAQDANNNTVTSFTSTVNLTTTAGTISPTTSSAFTAGVLTQSVTVTQAGTGRTITVNDGIGHTGTSNGFAVIASNTPPTITAQAGVSRQQGSPASNSQIATVSDAEQAVNTLTVMVTSANPSNGVTISNIVNAGGAVTADIIAACGAANASFTLQVSDGSLTNTASLAVSVTATAAPTVSYGNASVNFGGATMNSPTTATDNGSITGYAVQSPGTYTGTISVNSSGMVSITNAKPGGAHTITIRATDNCGATADASFTLAVNCPAITVGPMTLPNGTAGLAYGPVQFTQTNGSGAITWSVGSNNLPGGLMLDSSSGLLSGAPTAFGTFTITVRATDANACFGEHTYSLTINPPCGAITLTPPSLPNGFVGTPYSATFGASGGAGSYNFEVSGGTKPAGLTLSSGGALTGTPNAQGTYTFTVKATDASGCTGTQSYTVIVSGNGLMFYPLPRPVRLMDTRSGQGNCDSVSTPVAAGTSLTILARTTCEGIALPPAARAVAGNITAINQSGQPGYLTLYPDGVPVPTANNLIYFNPGQIIANNFTVGLSSDGKFNVFGERAIDVVVDISGYYAPPGAGGLYYHPLARPLRLLDTRPNEGTCDSVSTPVAAGTSITTLARTTCEGLTIPQAARALAANATVVNVSGQTGYLTIYPNGVGVPLASNIVYYPEQIISNAFTVSLSAAGEFNIFGERAIHMVIDVAGYYSAEALDAGGPGLLFNPLPSPVRILDTRAGQGNCDNVNTPITGGTSIATSAWLTCEGIPIPTAAQAVLGNVTVINQTSQAGYLTLYPDGFSTPLVSNMVYFPNELLSNAFVVGVNGGTGQFRLFAERTLDAVVDVSGYFAP